MHQEKAGCDPERLRTEDLQSLMDSFLNSALVLAGILPLALRIREAATLYEAKRGVTRTALKGREVERKNPGRGSTPSRTHASCVPDPGR